MVNLGVGEGGFCCLSSRDLSDLICVVSRDTGALPDGRGVAELYGDVCSFLDEHEDDPVAGSLAFVERASNRGFGLLASVRGYLRMLSIIEQTDSLAFCNQAWQDAAVGDVTMAPVFEALDQGATDVNHLATALYNGGVTGPGALPFQRFAAVFERLPLFCK